MEPPQLLLGRVGNSGCKSEFLFGESLGCFGRIFGGFHGTNHARRGCDNVCSSFFSSGQSPSAMEDLLDVENKRMADSLASKVTRLKSVSAEVTSGVEVKDRL